MGAHGGIATLVGIFLPPQLQRCMPCVPPVRAPRSCLSESLRRSLDAGSPSSSLGNTPFCWLMTSTEPRALPQEGMETSPAKSSTKQAIVLDPVEATNLLSKKSAPFH